VACRAVRKACTRQHGGRMNDYIVTWRIELRANSKQEAAELAREIQLDPNSRALVFEVAEDIDLEVT